MLRFYSYNLLTDWLRCVFLQCLSNAIKAINTTCRLWTIFSFACLLVAQPAYAEEASVEYKIKAGYLYNFTKFIIWPEDKSPTFNLCILGADPFGRLIDPIEQRTASNRPIKLFRIADIAFFAVDKSPHCHILFAGALTDLPKVLPEATLTVGESDGFAQHGGIIGFVNKDGRIKLQINLAAVKQSGLKVSAKLLEVAEIIAEGG